MSNMGKKMILFMFILLSSLMAGVNAWAVTPQVAGGFHHNLAIKSDGTLWAWGWNPSGQLGDGTLVDKSTPTQIGTDTDWVAIAAGGNHSLAIKSDGTLWAWGSNWKGQLGIGPDIDKKNTPTQIGTSTDWIAIAAGEDHSLALKSDKTLWAWGFNGFGQLGDGSLTLDDRYTPTKIGTSTDWIAIAAGSTHSLALKSDKTLWAWGWNSYGQLGDGTTTNRSTPVQVKDTSGTGFLTGVVAIKAGFLHNLALKSDGTLWAWGDNSAGQLGLGIGSSTIKKTPTKIGTDTDWLAIAAGDHSLALKSDGTLWAWGWNTSGQLGDGTTDIKYTPTKIGTSTDWLAIAAGYAHSLAIKSDGSFWTWGRNYWFELGDCTYTDRYTPIQIPTVGLEVNPTSINFGNINVGNSSDKSVTVTNGCAVDLKIGTVTGPSTPFSKITDTCSGNTLTSSTTCSVKIRFEPPDGVTYASNINISSNVPDAPGVSVSLSGKGTCVKEWYKDSDNDGYSDGATQVACNQPNGYKQSTGLTATSGDCNDNDTSINPGAAEVCDNVDNDCDGAIDEGVQNTYYRDADGDGYGNASVTTQACSAPAGYVSDNTDCNDSSASVHPGVTEVCNGVDDNCNGQTDEGVQNTYYRDADVDTYGNASVTTQACTAPSGYVSDSADCNDSRFVINPGAVEVCNRVDDNCNGLEDEGCPLSTPGTPVGWGYNDYGQLGDGTTANRTTPVPVKGPGDVGFLTDVVAIAGGGQVDGRSLALKSDGTVWAWGQNTYGQLGDGTTTKRTTPVQVKGPGGVGFLTGVKAIAAGWYHSLALKNDGTVWAWGLNGLGQLGNGAPVGQYEYQSTPVQVPGLTDVTAIAAGAHHSLALKSDNTVWAWGSNNSYQLGYKTTDSLDREIGYTATPGQSSWLTGMVAIAAGERHSLALKSDGTVWAWGNNSIGQLGHGETSNWNKAEMAAVQVPGLTGVRAIAAGTDHSLALKSDGTVWGWGRNGSGQLGDGTTITPRSTPVPVKGPGDVGFLTDVTAIAGGSSHSLALKSDGTGWGWGYNYVGQLGDGTTITPRTTPVQVSGLAEARAIATGVEAYHSLAIAGNNSPTGNNVNMTIGAATLTFSSVTQDGITWVTTSYGGTPPPTGYRLDSQGTVYDINTTATFSGTVEVCLKYDETKFSNEGLIKLFHLDGSTWVDITTRRDTVANVVCGETASLSPFIMAEAPTPEVCDGVDNDFDGFIDEDLTRPTTCGVGACSSNTGVETCTAGVWGNDTCDPMAGATSEVCDGVDNDCDGSTDENLIRTTTCGVGACSSNTGVETCTAGVWGNNTCDPMAGATTEVCDGINNDCDGATDEGVQNTYYSDSDNDTYGNVLVTTLACSAPLGYVSNSTDCNDSSASVYPGATEACDGVDNDCDGVVDEGCLTVTAVKPNTLPQGAKNQTVTISGTYFAAGAAVNFSGTGITVSSVGFVSATQMTVNVTIASNAPTGLRDVTVTNPNGVNGTGIGLLTIVTQQEAISNMVNHVNQFLNSGQIGQGIANSLLASLNNTSSALERGNNNAAKGILGALINKLNAFEKGGQITSAIRDKFVVETNALISSL